MLGALLFSVILAIGWLTVRSMNREKGRRDRAEAIKARVRERHGAADLFVSREDGSFVGLSADGDRIIVGKTDDGHTFPVSDLLAVEGVRDGVVLIRAEPDGDPVTAAPVAEQGVADVPERIRALGLRLTIGAQVFEVLFFDGGRHGISPLNEAFRKQAVRAEAWHRKLSTAMRLAR